MGAVTPIDGEVLEGVSATTLWTLRNRATEAKRADGVIRDPWAITLLDAITYDYGKFGRPSQFHALRALAFDAVTRTFLDDHPNASVVALAEGLQSSFWRLDRDRHIGASTWYSVDLPPVIELRRRLLPHDDRIVTLPRSALDRGWMDRVDTSHGVLITAEGLLMYLRPDDALRLIRDCAQRFPGATMMFDSNPHWVSARARRGLRLSDRYVTPPLPFALSPREATALAGRLPGIASARDVRLPRGRGLFRYAGCRAFDREPLQRMRPSTTVLEFGS
ncbi:O-methyltransferase involved in polyketide biosynthesis [Mycolicibacterium chubuense NBB4]|uniref:O-methyltransferase involved in polyketide biosynthesis n=1 Tax=Mycolicibacterium chubuense (strain NBB4) TaxID=710421 RepID=I4BN44_MYCCN|nr:class I SAM-dependent methyltransferase [Mycolicibacterium chubuense]AFM18701.1 O-methyltransferase involved in polyketide biosynthesis [Mycolicibacterium chubuense NBB4]